MIKDLHELYEGNNCIQCCRAFFVARRFALEWETRTKEEGKTNFARLPGSPVSAIIVLILIALIIIKIRVAIKEMALSDKKYHSCDSDLHSNIGHRNSVHVQ